MGKRESEPRILLDADVVIHFIKAGYQLKLSLIFPNRLVILDKVKTELMRYKSEVVAIENFIQWSKIPIEEIPREKDILREYSNLRKLRGEGESACMAVARYRKEYIASCNLSDIKEYCNTNKIQYYTTMDILLIAIEKGLMSEAECDQFIKTVKSKNSKLPCDSIKEYRKAL